MKPTPSASRVAQAYSGNPDGQPIYPNEIDHGYAKPIAGDSAVMKDLVKDLRHEQGNPRLASRVAERWLAAREGHQGPDPDTKVSRRETIGI